MSLQTTEAMPQALAYNEDRSYQGQFDATPELLGIMDGEPKKYFYCSVNSDGVINIERPAPWQEW